MHTALKKLGQLQAEIHSQEGGELPDEYQSTLMFCETSGLIKIKFYGDPAGESDALNRLLRVVVDSDVSPYVKSLEFSGPDKGANGTRAWGFGAVVESDAVFTNLTSFLVEGTLPEHHNRSIISGDFYEEGGMIAGLLGKMPSLLSLGVPSAPDHNFFRTEAHPLNTLVVQAGYDTQDFILNLGRAACFPGLRRLDFTDYQETYAEDYESGRTPFGHYKELFLSPSLDEMRLVVLRNPRLSREEAEELKSLKKGVQLMLIRTTSEYV